MYFDMISAKDVDEYIGKKNIYIIDLRDEEDYNIGHIPGAINIPYDDFMERCNKLSVCKEYILYCERGGSSILASRTLYRLGYHVKNVYGGINAYRGILETSVVKIDKSIIYSLDLFHNYKNKVYY